MRRLLFVIACILLALSPVRRLSAQGSGSPILAIGDSITAGTAGPSYLCPLKTLLPGAAFVGPQPATTCGTSHAGYGGYVSSLILSRANEWMPYAGGATVVIHVGTNDVYSGFDLDRITIPNIRQIIQKAQSANPRAIILAQIIPSRDNPMTDINSRLAALARETGVQLANAGNCFRTDTDMVDKVHPNDHGAQVISANIAAAIRGSAPPSVCDQTATPEPPLLVDAGLPNKPKDVSQSKSLDAIKESILSFFFGGKDQALAPRDLRIPTFDFLPMLKGAIPYLMPKVIQEKIVNAGFNNLSITGGATLCVRNPATGELRQSAGTGLYRTEPVQQISDQDASSRQIAPFFTGYALSPDSSGLYDLRRRPLVLAGPPGCGEDAQATEQESVSAPVTDEEVTFSQIVVSILRSFFGNQKTAKTNAQIFSKQVVPYQESSYCLIRGCTNEDIKLSYLNEEEANRVRKAGFIKANEPKVLDFSEGEMHGEQDSTFDNLIGVIKTRVFGSKAIENATKNFRCSLTPQALQQKAGLDCQTKAPSAPAACGDCTTANAECDKRAGQYTLKPPIVNANCSYSAASLNISSPTLSGYFESVANFFGIPPQLLAGIVAIETRGLALTYTESFVQNASKPDANSYDVNFCKPPTNRNFCGALGITQVSAPVCMERVEKECPVAVRDQNWTEWCSNRNAPGEFRNLPGYQANPANILDSLVVGASVLKKHVGPGCPAKTSLTRQAVMEVGRSYYGNCAGRDTPIPGQYVSPELLQKLPRFLPPGVSASSFIDIPMRQALSIDGKYSTSTAGLTYCEFLWGYYSTH